MNRATEEAVNIERLRCFAWAVKLRNQYYEAGMAGPCGAMDAIISHINNSDPATPEMIYEATRPRKGPTW